MSIEKLMKLPTSDQYILSKIKTNIVVYSDLKKYKSIDELFVNNSCIILYENTAGNIGHWTCLIKRGNTLSYFDSYGRAPDPEEYIGNKFPYLSNLLLGSGYNLEYSEKDYQKKGVSTCGHHCIIRIIFGEQPLKKYQIFMKQFKNDDEVVTAISQMI